jgi:hypothetical protein
MSVHRFLRAALLVVGVSLLAACATPPQPFDYSAYKASRPASILVLPPLNNSTDINATASVLAQVTQPLAESGYYVLPVTLMTETFKNNGLTVAADIHDVAPAKLRQIFGADAALYIGISRYGASYTVFDSAAIVSAHARLVDLRSGQVLWSGSASASSAEQNNNSQGGLVGLLVTAIVTQVLNNLTDKSHQVAGVATGRLLSARPPNGLLYGPRSPKFGTD